MNEKGLIEQVLRIINANYSNIYVIDIPSDKVYTFGFTVVNSLIIKDTMTYTDFIDVATKFVHKDELSDYFNALSLNNLEVEAQKGNSETKIKYRKLCETGEYRWFVNIINYLPFEGRKLIFMMSEDVNERLTDSEENTLKLESEIVDYKNKLNSETESISSAIFEINNLLENGASASSAVKIRDTKDYINSIFNRVSVDHPDLNKAILTKVATTTNYRKPVILIVDDSSIIRNSLKRIFANEYDIIMAKDGREAINLLEENVVNHSIMSQGENIVAVLLDLVMPGCDGFAVLDYMKEHNLFASLPVAIISGDETRETRKKVYQYQIVDMLEKPFNTENIRRRISKIINLYMSSNKLQNIVEIQHEELKTNDTPTNDAIKKIVGNIVNNILNTKESTNLKKMVRILSLNLANKYPDYNIDSKKIDYMVNTCALYNIGSIAMSDDVVVTSQTIKESISYGLSIIDAFIVDDEERKVASNIIKYSCEMFNGSGYPNGIKGNEIPIEAQITNILVRLNQHTKSKSFATAIKNVTTTEANKYNPDIIDVLKDSKKELKEIL